MLTQRLFVFTVVDVVVGAKSPQLHLASTLLEPSSILQTNAEL